MVAMKPTAILRESAPIAGIFFLWWVPFGVTVTLPHHVAIDRDLVSIIATTIQLASLVMVALYVGARSSTLSETYSLAPQATASQPNPIDDWLRENLHVGAVAGLWFAGGLLVLAIELLPDTLAYAFTGTGVATVVLYALAVGIPRVRGEVSNVS